MEEIKISTEWIKLDAFMKWAAIVSSGSEAKMFIQDELVKVNDVIEVRRGRKLYKNDIVEFNENKYKVI